MNNKDLISILEPLTLNVAVGNKIRFTKGGKKAQGLASAYHSLIKRNEANENWVNDPTLKQNLQAILKDIKVSLKRAEKELINKYLEDGHTQSDAQGAAQADFMSDGIDPVKFEARSSMKKKNPKKKNPVKTQNSKQEEALTDIHDLANYFQECEENEEGISTKATREFISNVVFLIKELGVGVVLDLSEEVVSDTAPKLLRRALDEAVPGFSEMFKKNPSSSYGDMSFRELLEQEKAALSLLRQSSSEFIQKDTRKDLAEIRKVLSHKYNWNWITKEHKQKKSNPISPNYKREMGDLYEFAKMNVQGSRIERLLDIAHKAVRVDELDYVLEECIDPRVCDYAKYKRDFFIAKGMKSSNPSQTRKYPLKSSTTSKINKVLAEPYDREFAKAEKILSAFIKNAGGKSVAIELIMEEVHGELPEFTARGLDGYMVYGNREVSIYVDDIEEPFSAHVDVYGDRPVLVWG